MALDSLTALANEGAGTDQLAGQSTPAGFAGAVVGTDGTNPERLATQASLSELTGFFKAEDTAAASGDKGLVMLAQRYAADAPTTDTDGDYTILKMDEKGRLKVAVQPGKYDLVSGNITSSAQTVFCDCSRGSNVIAHVVPAPTMAGHNCVFEASIDSSTGTDGTWFAIDAKRTNANTVELTTGTLAAAPAYAWELSVNGYNFVRVRATAHTSGTATWKFQQAPYATEPAPAIQVTGTQTVSMTSTTVNPVVPATPYFLNSAATTNGALIITGTSGLSAFYATNEGAGVAYVKLYNKATAPTVGTDIPEMVIPVPAAVSGVPGVACPPIGFHGFRFALGLGIAVTGGSANSDTTAVAAGQVKVKLSRTV